jgi:general secretion pathway protein G
LSIVALLIVTAWRVGRRSTHGSSRFLLGTAIAVLNAMPSPRDAIHRGASRGFTLLEILVVITLISLLTTGVAVGALKMLEDAKIKQAKTDAASLAAIAEAFVITHGDQDCPTPERLSRDGLLSHRSNIEDPWGTGYRIQCELGYTVASSAGPDRAFETGDDVKSDEP